MAKAKTMDSDGGNLYERANDMFVKVTAGDTDGSYEVCEERCPAGFASRYCAAFGAGAQGSQ